MAIVPGGTFDYIAVVPPDGAQQSAPWPVQPGDAVDYLVGPSPTLRIVDAGLAPGQSGSTVAGAALPRVMRSRIVLTASGRAHALAAEASFHIEQELAAALVPGDTLRMVRNHIGGLAVAMMRGHELMAAAGAITAVPLGHVTVRIPRVLIEAALDVFRADDPDFAFREWPVEVAVGHERSLLFAGRRDIGGYHVFVEHGLFAGDSASSECLSISRTGLVPDVVAIASAQLLDSSEALQITRW